MSELKKSNRIALYARVSTLLNQDPENQLVHLREFAASRGFEVVSEFVDHGISGAKERRPALDEMLREARKGKFSHIAITALDRLGRNTKHMLTLMDEFKHMGVSLTSLREGIDMSSPMGQLVMTVVSAIAQLERSLISERIKNALAAKKLAAQQSGSNWKCGRPMVTTPELCAEVSRLRAEGVSIRKIAKQVGVAKSTVQRILKSVPKNPSAGDAVSDRNEDAE